MTVRASRPVTPRAAALLAFLALTGSCTGARTSATRPEAARSRPVHTVSLDEARAIVEAVGAPALFTRVSEPNAYLTDFFGVQILRPHTRAEVMADFVPRLGHVVGGPTGSLRIELAEGGAVEFFFDTDLSIAGNVSRVPFARIAVADPARYPEPAERFRATLVRSGLAERYLVPNPYHAAELVATERLRQPDRVTVPPVAPDTAGFGAASHAVAFVGETHGGTANYEQAHALLQTGSVDWLGMEMLAAELQPALDAFLREPAGSPAFANGRRALLEYYAANWNTRGHEVTATPAENPYFRLIERARELGKRVYALDASPVYIAFRFGEFPLGAATRDYIWASRVPPAGRGIVYGGSSHFSPQRRPNLQSFLRERFPAIALFSVPRP